MDNQSLIARAKTNGNPVIEGHLATFIWVGRIAPYLIDDFHAWEEHPQKLTRLEKEAWAYSLELPATAYLEYSFYEPRTKKRIEDPLNINTVYNGIGHYNHFFYMPEHSPTEYALRKKNILHGKVTRHQVDTWMLAEADRREVYLYHPPVNQPVPLLLVYDGLDYLERGKLNVIVDNLIHEKRMQPVAMAFLQNGGEHRGLEYACSDATIMWLNNILLPFAQKKINLLDIKTNPGKYAVLGASFGGLMSMYTGLRMPEIFGKVISQSGVFESEGRDFVAVDLIRNKSSREIKIWMDIGYYDWLLEDNRRLQSILNENGYDVTYREFYGGHNYNCWRDEIWLGLEHLFGM